MMAWSRSIVTPATSGHCVIASHVLRDCLADPKWVSYADLSAPSLNDGRDYAAVARDGKNAIALRSTSTDEYPYLVVGPLSGAFDSLYMRISGADEFRVTVSISSVADFSSDVAVITPIISADDGEIVDVHYLQDIYSGGGGSYYAYTGDEYYLSVSISRDSVANNAPWACHELWLGTKRQLPTPRYAQPAYSYGNGLYDVPTDDQDAPWSSESGVTTAFSTSAGLVEVSHRFELKTQAEADGIIALLAECKHGRETVIYSNHMSSATPSGHMRIMSIDRHSSINRTAWGTYEWAFNARECAIGRATL